MDQEFDALPPLRCVTAAELLEMELAPREMVLGPVIPVQGLAMIYAPRGVGKTFVALSIAHAVATGGTLFGWEAPKPRRVLYLDGEMPGSVMRERLAAIAAGSSIQAAADAMRFITADLQERGMPDLATPEGQEELEPYLAGCDLLIIDNLSTLCRSGKENEAESWTAMQGWLLTLRRRGISVLLVHHAGKGGQQRGTSRREDVLDTIISLKKPADFRAEEGARFEIVYEKARGFHGNDATSFEAKLEIHDGVAVWSTQSLQETELLRIVQLTREGLSTRDIQKETGISKSRVGRMIHQARSRGML